MYYDLYEGADFKTERPQLTPIPAVIYYTHCVKICQLTYFKIFNFFLKF